MFGEIVYVDLPAVGKVLNANASVAVVESVKATEDVYTPLPGKVRQTCVFVYDEDCAVLAAVGDVVHGDTYLGLSMCSRLCLTGPS